MLEIEISKYGQPVVKKNGKFLGSSYDPARDGVVWVDQIAASVKDHSSVVILGMGSGYHVTEFLARFPEKLTKVIEPDRELIVKVREIFPNLAESVVCSEEVPEHVIFHNRMVDVMQSSFLILRHEPSCRIDVDYFQQIEKILLGRDLQSLRQQLKIRPEMMALIDSSKLDAIENEVISIKTLQKLFRVNAPEITPERALWKILEELVK